MKRLKDITGGVGGGGPGPGPGSGRLAGQNPKIIFCDRNSPVGQRQWINFPNNRARHNDFKITNSEILRIDFPNNCARHFKIFEKKNSAHLTANFWLICCKSFLTKIGGRIRTFVLPSQIRTQVHEVSRGGWGAAKAYSECAGDPTCGTRGRPSGTGPAPAEDEEEEKVFLPDLPEVAEEATEMRCSAHQEMCHSWQVRSRTYRLRLTNLELFEEA